MFFIFLNWKIFSILTGRAFFRVLSFEDSSENDLSDLNFALCLTVREDDEKKDSHKQRASACQYRSAAVSDQCVTNKSKHQIGAISNAELVVWN